ncbi:MAG: hypothetical protein Q4G14_13580 [Paracoccus sp. (in: a-proteobacteria)]|uniref:hypothetical protein n=1 Tax=Paracoccus sp. TaxID=267 RepID=UPI0026E0B477|nr:hypothetical protein [Paracoccus sp. (in: a-proteobacteria)]MDO5614256.1 hypothetical protein [Paracoccus sp. (in: a-proteobacteria)]
MMARLGLFTPALAAAMLWAAVMGILMRDVWAQVFAAQNLTHQEYFNLRRKTENMGRWSVTGLAAVMIWGTGTVRWGWHRMRMALFPRLEGIAHPATLAYFQIITASTAAWWGVGALAVTILMPLGIPSMSVLSLMDEYPWALLVAILGIGMLQRRADAVKRDRHRILFPDSYSRRLAALTNPWHWWIIACLVFAAFRWITA